jgi:hypothetical protein
MFAVRARLCCCALVGLCALLGCKADVRPVPGQLPLADAAPALYLFERFEPGALVVLDDPDSQAVVLRLEQPPEEDEFSEDSALPEETLRVANGTAAEVLEDRGDACVVRVTSGPFRGRQGTLPSRCLKPREAEIGG